MITGREVAEWFIYHNPHLASGYIDENTKINKLLYFSNLLYYCVTGDTLIDEEFIAFPNGPVVFSVYRDYRYNGLNQYPHQITRFSTDIEQILNIINFVYGNYSTKELVKETHEHSLWKEICHLIPNNPTINFQKVDPSLESFYKSIFDTYSNFDFSRLIKEKIGGNTYYYIKDNLEISDDIIEELSKFPESSEPHFLEIINGELVVS